MAINPIPDPQINAVPVEPQVGGAPIQGGLGAAPIDARISHGPEFDIVGRVKEQKCQIGLQYSSGDFAEASNPLNPEDHNTLKRLLKKYAPSGMGNFAINLSNLKDANGHVLTPLTAQDGTPDPGFEKDMEDLRAIAERALGYKIKWDAYPTDPNGVGLRAILGRTVDFSTGPSQRLKQKLDFHENDLQKWLEEIGTVRTAPDPNDVSEEGKARTEEWNNNPDTEVKAAKRVASAMKRYMASIAMMDAMVATVDAEIEKLQNDFRNKRAVTGDQGRLEKLKQVRDQLPEGTVKPDKAHQDKLRSSGLTTQRAAILMGAVYMGSPDEEIDAQTIQENIQKHINTFEKPLEDCSGMLDRFKEGTLLEERAQAEEEFAKAVALSSISTRREYEPERAHLHAEERSDGPGALAVRLNNAVATAANENDAKALIQSNAFDAAFNLDPRSKAIVHESMIACAKNENTRLNKLSDPDAAELQNIRGYMNRCLNAP